MQKRGSKRKKSRPKAHSKRSIARRKKKGKPAKRPQKKASRKKPVKRRRPKKIARDVARKFLRNVSPEKSFWIMEGPIIKNLSELLRELKLMNSHTFAFHVNRKRNDFSKWIHEVIGDHVLARDIKKSYSKSQLLKKVQARVKMMRKVLG